VAGCGRDGGRPLAGRSCGRGVRWCSHPKRIPRGSTIQFQTADRNARGDFERNLPDSLVLRLPVHSQDEYDSDKNSCGRSCGRGARRARCCRRTQKHVFVDGRDRSDIPLPTMRCVIGGDGWLSGAAASIIAKVTRDDCVRSGAGLPLHMVRSPQGVTSVQPSISSDSSARTTVPSRRFFAHVVTGAGKIHTIKRRDIKGGQLVSETQLSVEIQGTGLIGLCCFNGSGLYYHPIDQWKC